MAGLLEYLLPEAARGVDGLSRVDSLIRASGDESGSAELAGVVVREVARGCERCLDVWGLARAQLRRGCRAETAADALREPVRLLGRAREFSAGAAEMFRSLGVALSIDDEATLTRVAGEVAAAHTQQRQAYWTNSSDPGPRLPPRPGRRSVPA